MNNYYVTVEFSSGATARFDIKETSTLKAIKWFMLTRLNDLTEAELAQQDPVRIHCEEQRDDNLA